MVDSRLRSVPEEYIEGGGVSKILGWVMDVVDRGYMTIYNIERCKIESNMQGEGTWLGVLFYDISVIR